MRLISIKLPPANSPASRLQVYGLVAVCFILVGVSLYHRLEIDRLEARLAKVESTFTPAR